MLPKFFLMVTALQAVLATTFDIDVETNDRHSSDSQLEQFLRTHDNIDVNANLGNTSDPHGEVDIQARDMGNVVIGNRCPHDIWVWSVDQKGSSKPIRVPKRTKYSEQFRTPCNGCGVSLKVSRTNKLETGKHTQFEYAISKGQIYYDVSFVNCAKGKNADNCPGHDKGLAMDSPEAKCGRIDCKGGSYCPTQAYYVDTPLQKLGIPEPVFGCGTAGTGMTLYMKTCSDEPPLKRSVAGRMIIGDEV